MKKFLAALLHILSFIIQLAAFAFALMPIVYWLSGFIGFLSFIYNNEYIIYTVSGALALLIVLTGTLIRIKRGKFILAVLAGGVLYAGLAFLVLSNLTSITVVPDTFKVFAVRRLFWGFLDNDLYLYIAVGALLLIAFILSAFGRRLSRKKAGKVRQKKTEPANMISSSQANDQRFEPAVHVQEIDNQIYVYQQEPGYAAQQASPSYQEPAGKTESTFFEPSRVIPQPEPDETNRPRTPQPQRQVVYIRDEQGNLVLENSPDK